MTCKDCIHYDVCGGYTLSDLDSDVFHYARECRTDEIPDIEERCNGFKDKSRFVELPCNVGDTVYYIEGAYYKSKRQTVTPIKATEMSWKCDGSGRDLGFALIANGTRYKFSSIGKTVFLTRDDAERALAERK